jgi:hypothetical protein
MWSNKRVFLFLVSVTLLICGVLLEWISLLFLFEQFGGFNIFSVSLSILVFSPFLIGYVHLFRYALGKPIRRWQFYILQVYIGLMIFLGLGYGYDRLLPDDLLAIWPWVMLPMFTIAVAYHLLNRIPQVREQLDKLRETT